MMPSPTTTQQVIKPVLFILCLLPLLWLGVNLADHTNPIDELLAHTGVWTLRLLLLTLLITPLRKLTGWHGAIRLRRMLGLFAFFYAVLHVASYLIFEQSLHLGDIIRDIIERPFIAVGFLAFFMMIPLAATSSNQMVKRLGGRRWQRLHQLVYLVAIAGVVHFWWLAQSKADIQEPLWYAVLLLLLLFIRHPPIMRRLQLM